MKNTVSAMMILGAVVSLGAFAAAAQPGTTPRTGSPSASPSAAFELGPPRSDGPVVVQTSFELRDMNDIDDARERFEFDGILELTWRDERQAFDPAVAGVEEKIYQGAFQFNEISPSWFPQVVLVNESGLFEKHGVLLRVRPDGTSTLIETVNAAAEANFDLRRYPFDEHCLDATFEVLGTDSDEVVLVAAREPSEPLDLDVRIPQWRLTSVEFSTGERIGSDRGVAASSTFVVSVDVERESFFVIRLVVIPLMLIVMLSWSVFWMERSSLADRLSVSFIGILTAVAYQIVVSEIQPDISYMTLMHGFLNLSFLIMCATVVINLFVGALDRRGRDETGNRIDRRCRWIFPLTYFGLIAVMVVVTFTFF